MKVEFFVPGIPLPQPRPRARAMRVGAHHIAQVYNPKSTDAWKKMIWVYAMQNRSPEAYIWPSAKVWLVFYMPRPKHHYHASQPPSTATLKPAAPQYHTIRPDLDNLAKPVLDSLTSSGCFWDDDGAVCQLNLGKRYDTNPGVHITISSP